ncbi:MAG: hypothetical protein HY821_18190 [Acidobacteria bacterium]|nr:hypothetical protein [Acidobacteriota bacterium]
MRRILVLLLALLSAALLWGMTVNGSLAVLGTLTANVVDFGASSSTAPNKSGIALPATCSVGQTYFKTDAAAGRNLYLCTAANTWTVAAGAAASAAEPDPTDVGWMVHREECMAVAQQNASNAGWIMGENLWFLAGLGGSGYSLSGVQPGNTDMTDGPNHPGQWLLQTGATSGTAFALTLAPYAKTSAWLDASRTGWKACWVFKLGTTTQMSAWIGLGNDTSLFAWYNYVALYYDATTTAQNFRFRTGKYTAGTNADFDTGIAGDTAWHTFCIQGDDVEQGKVRMKLDGVEKTLCGAGCDVTATIVNDKALQTEVRLKTNEAASKSLYLDYYGAKARISTQGVR